MKGKKGKTAIAIAFKDNNNQFFICLDKQKITLSLITASEQEQK